MRLPASIAAMRTLMKANMTAPIAEFDEVLELYPNYTNALISRGAAHRATRNYDRAMADFDEAIRLGPSLDLNPNLALAFSERGMAYDGKDEYGAALLRITTRRSGSIQKTRFAS